MARYTGIPCPVCGKPFEDGDDVVVCPECGTPHHRACYARLGACVNQEHHGEHMTWQPPAPPQPPISQEPRVCPRCGAQNPPGTSVCQVCSTPLPHQGEEEEPEYPFHDPDKPPTYGYGEDSPSPSDPVYRQIPLNPFFNPLGGLSPQDTIEGIPVTEIAMFVGPNSHYYLPRFYQLAHKGSGGFCWSGAVISFIYFLYRKVALFAVISVVLSLCLSLPATFYTVKAWDEALSHSQLSSMLQEEEASQEQLEEQTKELNRVMMEVTRTQSYQTAARIQSVSSLFSLGVSLTFGFFATRIYKGHVVRTIRKLRQRYPNEAEYKAMLVKKGGVNRVGVLVLMIGYLLANLLPTLLVFLL